jgi:CubicO group peptidase (beta-lactamase class C family)
MSPKRILLFLSLLLASLTCTAQVQAPDTPAGKQFAAWLQAFNQGGEAYRSFLQAQFPARVQRVAGDLDLRERTGGFELKKIDAASATKIVALVQERVSDQMARITMEVAPDAPYPITKFQGMAIARPAEFALPHLTEAELVAAVRQKQRAEASADRFAGAALVAKNGKPIFAQADGLADRERKIPNTLNTRFRLGSMNKMFTAVATLQLVQAGKLDLNTPIGRYLTDYPNQEIASRVTIHQLLTHTGGTGDFFGPEFDKHRLELKTLNDYVKLFGARGPQFDPGSKWEYSNYGFLLLGVIIERVSGQSYYDYVRDHVYKPADMTTTGSEPEDQSVGDRSIGYTKLSDDAPPSPAWRPNTDTLPYRGTSAGGGYSTVEDLLRFALALGQHKLLDAHYTELLTTAKVETPGGGHYAYGFDVVQVNGIRCFGHNGGAPGMNGSLQICPSNGYVVAVLANLDPPAAQRMSDFISNRLPEK